MKDLHLDQVRIDKYVKIPSFSLSFRFAVCFIDGSILSTDYSVYSNICHSNINNIKCFEYLDKDIRTCYYFFVLL